MILESNDQFFLVFLATSGLLDIELLLFVVLFCDRIDFLSGVTFSISTLLLLICEDVLKCWRFSARFLVR